MLEQYDMNMIEYLFIKWQTRSLGTKADKMMALLPVCVCIAGEDKLEVSTKNIYRIIARHIRNKPLPKIVFRRIMFKARKYFLNQELFEENKHKVLEMVVQNIQMFSLILDAFEGIPQKLDEITEIIKEGYETSFTLPTETKRLLDYQERRYFSDEENTID
ncbi:hypothetical protein [Helicobacter brantae]|uniref:Uncharacterized protein n=1 Tax=Helicobacter brantae TaxID=375927 RepID=A0A3D8IXD7_9HELI|nr:hypothetical protein [Helicobacter brantae]RDU69723.1 hypothetical protein CQA58_06660 [Helicobacter brantae]